MSSEQKITPQEYSNEQLSSNGDPSALSIQRITPATGTKPTLLSRLRSIPVNIKRWGIANSARLYLDRIQEVVRERRLNIETKATVTSQELGYIPECNQYEPIHYGCLDIMFEHLKPNFEREVFIDIGSGKGRAVIVAGTYPFRKVIGVELSAELCNVARKNIQKTKKNLKCSEIEILQTDATQFDIPADATLIFIYNPFTGEVLSKTVERIREFLQRADRSKVRIVYAHLSGQPNMLGNWKWLRKITDLPMPKTQEFDERQCRLMWAVYEPDIAYGGW